MDVFNPEFHTGHFRQLTVRVATNQIMLIACINPQNLTENQLDNFKKELKEYFATGEGKGANITSLYCQYLIKRYC